MPTLSDLGQLVKRKYPGAYDDMDDQSLGQLVQQKYPGAYDDFSGEQKPKDTRPGIEKVGDFLVPGISNVAKGLGVSGGLQKDVSGAQESQEGLSEITQKLLRQAMAKPAGSPERKRMLAAARKNAELLNETGLSEDDVTGGVSNREFVSGLANTGITALGAGTVAGKTASGAGLQTGRLAARVAPQSLRRAASQAALQGGALGASTTLGKGGSAGEAAGSAALGAGFAGGTSLALGALGKLFGSATTKAPDTIYRTSTQVPEKTDAIRLIKEGVVGNRSRLEERARALVADAMKKIEASPASKAATNVDDLLQYQPLQRLRETAERVGDLDVVDDAIKRVMPKSLTGKIIEELPAQLTGLQDELDDLIAKSDLSDPAQLEKVRELAAKLLKKETPTTLMDLLKQKTAIDATSTPGVFADRSGSMSEKARNMVADAIRNQIAKEAPELTEQLGRQASAQVLLKELTRFQNARTRQIPGSLGNLIQRTLLTPAMGTRIASGLYKAGAPTRALGKTVMTEEVRRLLKALGISIAAGANKE